MEQNQILVITITILVVLALVIFLIWKNQKDKDILHPDEADSVKEVHTEEERKREKI